jgi:hypothetical protein
MTPPWTKDSRLQSALFEELVDLRPPWLSVAAYELDAHTRLLLLEVDDVARFEELPALAGYLRGLEHPCEGEPRAARLSPDGLDDTAEQIGAWDPIAGHTTIPAATTTAPAGDAALG